MDQYIFENISWFLKILNEKIKPPLLICEIDKLQIINSKMYIEINGQHIEDRFLLKSQFDKLKSFFYDYNIIFEEGTYIDY